MARCKKPRDPNKGIRIREREDGTLSYQALVKVDGKQISLGTHDTLTDAQADRHAFYKRRELEGRAVPKDSGILTVAELGALCLANAPEWDVDRWRKRVLERAEFAQWPATDVGQEHVQVWIDQMANTPIDYGPQRGEKPSRGTLHSALSLLRRVYKWAKMPARKYVSHNPCEGVTIGNSTDAKPRSRVRVLDYLREDECQKLLDAPRSKLPLEPRTKFLVLLFSGARPADVFRLTWDRIDWENESIHFTSTKTSKRRNNDYTVHALPQLMAALREWHMHCGRRTEGLVFRNEDGEVFARGYDAGWANKRYRQPKVKERGGVVVERKLAKEITVMEGYRAKVGITRDVPLYALRHSCASHLLLGTVSWTGGRQWSREEVQAQLGHLDSAATEWYMKSLGILGKRAASESKAALKLQKKGK
jgi:integrase